MSGIKIRGTGRCVPSAVITNADYARYLDTSDEWIVSRTGIRERRHCRDGETLLSLCTEAAGRALERSGLTAADMGACIVATVSPDCITPATACLLQRQLGMGEDTLCFDLSAACSGFLFSLHTAECLLASAPRPHALVIGAEVLSRLLDRDDRSTCILFGDGAGAAVVEWRPEWKSICAVTGVRGDPAILRVPGVGDPAPSVIHMEGRAVYKFAVETAPRCMQEVLTRAGVSMEEVDELVVHQANSRILDAVLRHSGFPPEKCWRNMDRYGNTSAASIPLVLDELVEQGRLGPGKRALCVAFGGGLTWGGALVEFA